VPTPQCIVALATAAALGAALAEVTPILVVGSINMDVIIDVERMPRSGETIVASYPDTGQTVPGGKGANQAVAVSRLCRGGGKCSAQFVGQWGGDEHARALEKCLAENGVDISACGRAGGPSGQGLVFLGADGGVSSVVVAGSNAAWPQGITAFEGHIRAAGAVLLQREIPERVNALVAEAASAAEVPVFQDVGGEDRPIADELLAKVAFLSPNLSELRRLSGLPVGTEEELLAAARSLQARGARNVLVTRGEAGALLLAEDGRVLRQPAAAIPGGKAVDETGAGDSFRAAFAVAFVEGRPLEDCLRFAAAAGAVAVSRLGAVPSLPSREECRNVLLAGGGGLALEASVEDRGAGETVGNGTCMGRSPHASPGEPGAFPLKFGSRLNSMSARAELWDGGHDVLGWVRRQGAIKGLDVVDLNYPQHFSSAGLTVQELKAALTSAGLEAGAVGMRYPSEFRLGAFSNPDPALRRKAVELTIAGGRAAKELGARELVVWSAYDGYDYSLQADYPAAWSHTVEAFRDVCDALPELRVSLEHKPTDENTRFYIVNSAGAAKLLVQEVSRPNMGITLDVGHCLMAGENPAQSAALIGDKLFGIHLNDGHSRLGAEDGLMLGTVHSAMAVELMYWLQRIQYRGHLYMDTFPHNEDPVRECEFNIRRAKALWARAERLRARGLDELLRLHDAMRALELMEAAGEL